MITDEIEPNCGGFRRHERDYSMSKSMILGIWVHSGHEEGGGEGEEEPGGEGEAEEALRDWTYQRELSEMDVCGGGGDKVPRCLNA